MTRPWGTGGADKLRDAIARIADAAEAARPLHSTLLQTQAAEVEKLRNDMYIVLSTLGSAKLIAFAVSKIPPPVGKQLSTTYQIATAAACLTTTTILLSAQRVRSNKTGAALNNVADSYSHIADAAQAARPLHS
jgi:hypothetical protein